MSLPSTVSCFSKIQIGFTFLVPAHPGSPGKGPLDGCVCVCVKDQNMSHSTWKLVHRPKVKKSSPYSITESRVPELIPVLGSQPAGDVSHKPGGRLPLLSARPAVTLATLKRTATNFAARTEARSVWTVYLRLLPDSVATAIWTQALLCRSPAR